MAGDSGYEPDFEEAQRMERAFAEQLASQGYTRALDDLNAQNAFQAAQAAQAIQETQQAAAQAQARADTLVGTPVYEAAKAVADDLRQQAAIQQIQQDYSAGGSWVSGTDRLGMPIMSWNPFNKDSYSGPATLDTTGLKATNPDWRGTNTLYVDKNGAVKGVYTSAGVVPVEALNPLSASGKPITADTLVQAVDESGQKLYLTDPNDPNSRTTRNTGIPAIGGTVAQQAFFMPKDSTGFGTLGSDLAGMAKDPAFWKFLASAAAITGGGLALNSAFGVGGLGAAGATAFPVEMGGLLVPTELGAAGASGAAAGGMTAAEALAAASQGGLGAEFGVQGALGGLNAGTAAGGLFGGIGASELIKGGLALGGLAAASALSPKPSQGTSGGNAGLTPSQLQQIVSTMPSAMGQYMAMASNPYGYGGGTIDSANANLANLFPGFSLPTTGPFYGAGRFGDAYAPQAASTAPISPTGLV